MDFRIISLPPFTAATSGPDPEFGFSPEGVLGKFNAYFSGITPSPRDSFMPRDFLFFNHERNGLEWWYALEPVSTTCNHRLSGLFEATLC